MNVCGFLRTLILSSVCCYYLNVHVILWVFLYCYAFQVVVLFYQCFYYYLKFYVIFRMLLLLFECLYYFLSDCLLVLMLSGCLSYSINICIISWNDCIIIRSNSLNVYVIIGVWGILWIFVLFSACFLMVLILLLVSEWCCCLNVIDFSWMMFCIFECVCYSVKFCIILRMFILFSACFYYGIYVVVIPELQCYSLNFVHPLGVFLSLNIFVILRMFLLPSKYFCYSLKVYVIC